MHRIIVRLPNWIGDAVMATPMLHLLRQQYPHDHITACAAPHILELLQGLPFFNETIPIYSKATIIPSIRHCNADIGILLTGSFSSAYHFWRANIPNILGFSCHFRRLFLTHPVSIPKNVYPNKLKNRNLPRPTLEIQDHRNSPGDTQVYGDGLVARDVGEGKTDSSTCLGIHDVQKYLTLLTQLSKRPLTEEPSLQLTVTPEEKEAIALKLQRVGILPHHKVLIVHPGAAYGEAKCWPKDYFKKALQHLSIIPSLRIIIAGNSSQKALADELAHEYTTVVSFAGSTNIRELMALIERADCVLTNDSGPMHMAAALKTPLVALFGSTNPKRTSPWKWGKVLYANVPCSPCYRRTCNKDFSCMRLITPEMVVKAVKTELGIPHDF